jgi:hypothetical protein
MRGTWQTTDGGGGCGGLVLAVIAVVLIGSGAASAAASAIVSALVTIAIILGSLIVLAVLGGIGWLVYRARQDRPGRPIAPPVVSQLPPAARPQLEGSDKPTAIEPTREVHLHLTVSPDQLAAILRHHTEGNQP